MKDMETNNKPRKPDTQSIQVYIAAALWMIFLAAVMVYGITHPPKDKQQSPKNPYHQWSGKFY